MPPPLDAAPAPTPPPPCNPMLLATTPPPSSSTVCVLAPMRPWCIGGGSAAAAAPLDDTLCAPLVRCRFDHGGASAPPPPGACSGHFRGRAVAGAASTTRAGSLAACAAAAGAACTAVAASDCERPMVADAGTLPLRMGGPELVVRRAPPELSDAWFSGTAPCVASRWSSRVALTVVLQALATCMLVPGPDAQLSSTL